MSGGSFVATSLQQSVPCRQKFGQYPEVTANCGPLEFPGRRQRDTQVTDVRGIIEIIMLLQGHRAFHAMPDCQSM